jgi:hypothetical protein
MSTRTVCTGTVLLLGGVILGAQTDPSAFAKFMKSQVNTHEAWGPQANSKGASVELVAKRVDASSFDVRLKTTGMSATDRYQLVSWPLNQRGPSVISPEVALDSDGYVTCPSDQKQCFDTPPGAQVILHLRPIPGEPTRLALLPKNHGAKAVAKTNLVPIDDNDRGCELRATLMLPRGVAVLFEGSGFTPNQLVTEVSISGSEAHNISGQADSNGKIYDLSLPAVKGLSRGEVQMTFKTDRCAPTVTVPWSTD